MPNPVKTTSKKNSGTTPTTTPDSSSSSGNDFFSLAKLLRSKKGGPSNNGGPSTTTNSNKSPIPSRSKPPSTSLYQNAEKILRLCDYYLKTPLGKKTATELTIGLYSKNGWKQQAQSIAERVIQLCLAVAQGLIVSNEGMKDLKIIVNTTISDIYCHRSKGGRNSKFAATLESILKDFYGTDEQTDTKYHYDNVKQLPLSSTLLDTTTPNPEKYIKLHTCAQLTACFKGSGESHALFSINHIYTIIEKSTLENNSFFNSLKHKSVAMKDLYKTLSNCINSTFSGYSQSCFFSKALSAATNDAANFLKLIDPSELKPVENKPQPSTATLTST